MAAGAAGVDGRPAAEERWRGLDSVTTQCPLMEVWHAEDCSKSLLNAFETVKFTGTFVKNPFKTEVQFVVCLSFDVIWIKKRK